MMGFPKGLEPPPFFIVGVTVGTAHVSIKVPVVMFTCLLSFAPAVSVLKTKTNKKLIINIYEAISNMCLYVIST